MSEQNKKSNLSSHNTFIAYDVFIALFYIIIICLGINHCITRGISLNPIQLYVISACLFGIVLFKILKYKKETLSHIREIIFPAVLFILSFVPAISNLLF